MGIKRIVETNSEGVKVLIPSDIKIGTTYIKGTRKRTVVGLDGVFVVYITPTSAKKGHVIGEFSQTFVKWAEKATVLNAQFNHLV